MSARRVRVFGVLGLAAATFGPWSRVEARSEHAAQGAPVAVAIVVDQLAAWVAEERLDALPDTGGFARLRRKRTAVGRITYPFARTETAPGHASLFTGKAPCDTGIVANQVWRADLSPPHPASLIEDPAAQLVGATGALSKTNKNGDVVARPGVGLKKLLVDTIGDELVAKSPSARIISLSLKDRGAIFAAPRLAVPDPSRVQVVWQDDATGQLVTSSRFSSVLPEWAAKMPLERKALSWTPADEGFLRSHAAPGIVDDQPGEDATMGGRAFPHRVASDDPSYWKKFRSTPAGDRLGVDMALAALDAECRSRRDASGRCRLNGPLLLALSLSSNDYVGHRFGPDSWEAWDELLQLDGQLARLLGALDEAFGVDGYSVVLSGDHGIGPLPGTDPGLARKIDLEPFGLARNRPPGHALSERGIRQELETALAGLTPRPASNLLADVSEALVTLDRGSLDAYAAEDASRREKVRRLMTETLKRIPGVSDVMELDAVCNTKSGLPGDSIPTLVRNSIYCDASHRSSYGTYLIVPSPGSSFADPPDMVSHGTPYLFDRAVPLLVRLSGGRPFDTGGGTIASFTQAIRKAFEDTRSKATGAHR